MKIVHSNVDAGNGWRQQAMQMEKDGDLQKAIALYRQVIKNRPSNTLPYDRLMIIFRKKKEYNKELAVINAGIKAFQNLYHSSKHTGNRKVTELSKAILRSTGLADKRGNPLFLREPVDRWSRRRELVERKLKQHTAPA